MRGRGISRLLRKVVVVETFDARTLRGILVGEYKDVLVLAHAAYVSPDADLQMAGEVYIPREHIAYVQVLPGGSLSLPVEAPSEL